LWKIDENLMRSELGAAEHAKLTKRRAEIIEAKAAFVSQLATPIKKKRRGDRGGRPRQKDRPPTASPKDTAKKTGKVERVAQRAGHQMPAKVLIAVVRRIRDIDGANGLMRS
jgi:hypothetical protein